MILTPIFFNGVILGLALSIGQGSVVGIVSILAALLAFFLFHEYMVDNISLSLDDQEEEIQYSPVRIPQLSKEWICPHTILHWVAQYEATQTLLETSLAQEINQIQEKVKTNQKVVLNE